MKRRTFLSAAAATAGAASLAACGSGTPGQAKDDPAAEGRTKVEFWGNVFTGERLVREDRGGLQRRPG
ncbi:hypothetical protein [Brachybacterium sp. UMB0905]|uniref:hypothetical protein n=1 Tax=Brachybacterium sp. UMB0905 TaxID=2069310 RepID=UPI001304682E|nr:hypothetical protein [Brachybacterium sp. UMB0905]